MTRNLVFAVVLLEEVIAPLRLMRFEVHVESTNAFRVILEGISRVVKTANDYLFTLVL